MINTKAIVLGVVLLGSSVLHMEGQVNVTTWDGGLTHTGLNSSETILTPLNVGATGGFGLLFTHPLDGKCYTQPLYISGVNIGGAVHNVIYVATEHDGVYAFDADSVTGANANPLWYDSLLPAGTTPVPNGDTGAGDITPELGVTGTPVIDTTTNTLYVVTKVKTTSNSTYQEYLHALDITSGAEKFGGPTLITTTFHGLGAFGEGSGSTFTFNTLYQHQRAALVLYNGIVYVTYASHGDDGTYHGIVLGYSASNLTLVKQFIATPNGFGAGIWNDGAGPAIDSSGNMYFATGNGAFDQATNSYTTDTDWGESFLKLPTSGTFDVSYSNSLNWFTPNIYNTLNNLDEDLGSSGVLLLPDQAGGSHPHLLIGGGKGGTLYVIDRDNMGGLNTTADNAVQELTVGPLFTTVAYFNGSIYFDPEYDHLYQRSVGYNPVDGSYIATSGNASTATSNINGEGISISANGTSNGIVWFPSAGTPSTLYAYNAANISGNPLAAVQTVVPGGSPINCQVPQFSVPTVVNGKVYLSAYDSSNLGHLFVYGLLATATTAPAAPTNLTATNSEVSRVALNWTDNSSNESGFAIMRATSASGPFTQVGSTGANVSTYNDSGLGYSTTYYYEVIASNNIGNSAPTNVASVTTLPPVSAPGLIAYWNFDEGNGNIAHDVTNNGYNGTLNGEVSWISGFIGAGALNFHGAGNAVANVTVPNAAALQFTATQSFTLSAWILPGGLRSTDEAVIAKSRDQGNYYGIWINSANNWAFRGPGGDVVGSAASTTNWTNVTVVQNGTANTRTIYVNGVSAGTGAAQAGDGVGNLWFGQANGVTNPFPGAIDEVRLYNVALTSSQVMALVNSGQTVYYQDSFTRTGELQGSAPDVHNTGSNTWTVSSGTGHYATTGTVVHDLAAAYDDAYLPVNGTSGVTLDGTANFTLSATITPDSTGYRSGIALNTAGTSVLDELTVGGTGLSAVTVNAGSPNYIGDSNLVSGSSYTISIAYSALNGTIIYSEGSNVLYTQTGVTASQIASLRAVALVNTNASSTATADNFTLSVANTGSSGTAPAAPTGLTAAGTSSQINLSWTGSSGATSYNVYRKSSSGTESANPYATGITSTTYADTGVASGTTYFYKVVAVNSVGTSSYSNEASGSLTSSVPPAPTGLTATPGNAQVGLTWTASPGATTYNVYRGTTAGGEGTTPLATGVTTAAYTDSTVTNGTTYYYTVAAVNSSGTSGYSNEANAVPTGGTLPSAPTGLTAAGGNTQVVLNWTASTGATSYNVYRGTSSGGEGTTALATGVSGATYTDTGLTNGTTYYYKVTAVSSSGTSGYSNEANATPAAPTAPAAPTGLAATGGNAQVGLSWTASAGATSYNVYQGTTSGGESTTALATGITTTTYTNTGLTNGTTYYYEVKALNSVGASGYSNEASATPSTSGTTTTYYSDSFTRTGDMTGSTPDVVDTGGATWGNLAGSGQYPIASGTASIPSSAYSWSAEALPVNGTSGITLDGTKDFTLSVVVTPSGVAGDRTGISLNTQEPGNLYDHYVAAMSTCSGFTGAYAFNGGTINYNFGAGIAGATTISISYKAATTTLTYTVGSTTLGTQTGVTAAEISSIRYIALGDDGYGGGAAAPSPTFDNFLFTVGSTGGSAPIAPTGLTATAGNLQVALAWTASAGATSYNVYRGTTTGGESTTAVATGIATPSYTDTGLTAGTTYYYKVAAVNSVGTSGYSNEANATPLAVPPAPSGLAATAGNAQIVLGWTASTGATSYNIYRGTSSGGESTTAVATGLLGTTYTDPSLTNGTTYYYEVKAVNSVGTSGYSNEASATPTAGTAPTAPTGLAAVAGNAQVGLTWAASTGATSYNIYRGTTSGGESATAIATGITTTSDTDTGLTNGTTYYYEVKAVNGVGSSGYSNEASATPTSGGGTATVYYQDGFTRTGDMTGSTPDVTDTGGATWANVAGTGQYPISGGTASINPAAYSWSAEYLPVNGATGIAVDGTKNFTLSVVVTTPSTGRVGICLSTSAPGNLYSSDFAAMSTSSGFTGAYAFNGGNINYNFGAGISGPTTISISYNASAGTLTYTVGSATLATQTGVTAAQVAAIRYVGLGDDGFGGGAAAPAPTFDNFTFTVGSGSSGTAPAAPTGLGATPGNAQVALSWTASSGATSYNVYRGATAGGESTTAVATGITTTSYTNTGLSNGTAYYYKVTAVNSYGTSAYSNEASATPSAGTAPAAPTSLAATAGNAQVGLTWTASAGATSYNIYRGTTSGGESSTAVATGIMVASYTDSGLTNGTTYYYKVAAVNSVGTSGYSNEASAAPTAGNPTIYYQDSFTRTGDMTGSTPDVTNTGGATWGNVAGSGEYPISGGTASIPTTSYSYTAEYLPVNGTSGITLDGTKNFTVSVVVTSGSTGRTGICLNTQAPGNLWDHYFASMSTCSGFAGAYGFNGGYLNYNYAAGISGPTTISISYNASTATLTYMVGTTLLATQTGVTTAQVSAIRYVGLGDDGYGGGASTPTPTFDNFTFSVGP